MKKILLILSLFLIASLNASDAFYSWGQSPTASFGGPFDAASYRMRAGLGWEAPSWYVWD
jgi:hypothetical protein